MALRIPDERETEKLMEAARGNRWGHRDATATDA
jgi:hypothetical protein